MEKHKNTKSIEENCNEEFLKEVYIQCHNIYLAFVNFRFQLFAIFVSNAALFSFVYHERTNLRLDLMISIIGIIIAWIMFFIDRRNRHIFKRVIQKAELIEIYFNIPEDLRIHSKSVHDEKNKVSHSLIFTLITIGTTIFWLAYLVYSIVTYLNL